MHIFKSILGLNNIQVSLFNMNYDSLLSASEALCIPYSTISHMLDQNSKAMEIKIIKYMVRYINKSDFEINIRLNENEGFFVDVNNINPFKNVNLQISDIGIITLYKNIRNS